MEKASLPDVSSVAFKASQNLLSPPDSLSCLLPPLPVPEGLQFLLSPALGSRGSSNWQLRALKELLGQQKHMAPGSCQDN